MGLQQLRRMRAVGKSFQLDHTVPVLRPSITKSSSLSSRSTSVETLLLFSKHDAHSSCQVFTQSEEIPRGLRVER